jgi:hypothetical protein
MLKNARRKPMNFLKTFVNLSYEYRCNVIYAVAAPPTGKFLIYVQCKHGTLVGTWLVPGATVIDGFFRKHQAAIKNADYILLLPEFCISLHDGWEWLSWKPDV